MIVARREEEGESGSASCCPAHVRTTRVDNGVNHFKSRCHAVDETMLTCTSNTCSLCLLCILAEFEVDIYRFKTQCEQVLES